LKSPSGSRAAAHEDRLVNAGQYQTVPQGLQTADRGGLMETKAANWLCGWTTPTRALPNSNKSPTSNERATSNQLPRHCKGNNTSKQIQHKENKIHTSKSRSNKKTSKNKQKHTQQGRHVQGSLPGVADAITFWSGELERTPAANWSAEL